MKKWYDEEYEFTVEVTGFLHGDKTERYCRNGEEIGDKYTCTYGCPVNKQGYGICSKTMMMLYPLMEAVRSGGDLENLGEYAKTRDSAFRVPFDDIAKELITDRQKKQLRKILNFIFTRDNNYNLPADRLKVLEAFIRSRAGELLSF